MSNRIIILPTLSRIEVYIITYRYVASRLNNKKKHNLQYLKINFIFTKHKSIDIFIFIYLNEIL